MKKLIEKLLAMLKSKNVELSADEQSDLFKEIIDSIEKDKQLPQDIKIPDNLQHNTQFIKQLQDAFQNQIDEMAKKNNESISALMKQNEDLTKLLGEEKQKREEGLRAIEEQNAKDRAAKIESVIAEMVKAEKIPANNEEIKIKYKTLLEKDFDNAQAIIAAIPGKPESETKTIDPKTSAGTVKHSSIASIVNPAILARIDAQTPAN